MGAFISVLFSKCPDWHLGLSLGSGRDDFLGLLVSSECQVVWVLGVFEGGYISHTPHRPGQLLWKRPAQACCFLRKRFSSEYWIESSSSYLSSSYLNAKGLWFSFILFSCVREGGALSNESSSSHPSFWKAAAQRGGRCCLSSEIACWYQA